MTAALVALVTVGCSGPAPKKPQDPVPYGIRLAQGKLTPSEQARSATYARERRAAVEATLAKRARAVLTHDAKAFLATVDQRDPAFVSRQRQLFRSLALLPLAAWTYEVAPDEHAYPPREDALKKYRGDVFAPAITLRLQLKGYDLAPVARPHVYTFVQRDASWLVASDSDYDESLVVNTKQDPWDVGAVALGHGRHALVVGSKRDADRLPSIARAVDRAVETVARFWPEGWSHRVVVVVSRNPKVLGNMLVGDANPEGVGALAVPQYGVADQYTVERRTPPRAVGSRVVVNPAALSYDSGSLAVLLTHEVVHVATQTSTGHGTPAWIVEGYAEHVAQHDLDPTDAVGDDLYDEVDGGELPAWLPSAQDFAMTHGQAEYDKSWLACRYVADTWGERRLAALYRALGRIDDPALTSERTDVVLRRTLGMSQEAFVKGWQHYLRRVLVG